MSHALVIIKLFLMVYSAIYGSKSISRLKWIFGPIDFIENGSWEENGQWHDSV